MSKSSEIALLAQIDQLRTALREVLRLLDSEGLGVDCETCGVRANRSCFGEDAPVDPHEARIKSLRGEVRRILLAALGRKGVEGKPKSG